MNSRVSPHCELFAGNGRDSDGGGGLEGDDSCVCGAGLSGLHGNDIDNRTSRKERSDEVDAVGHGAEGRVEDSLCNPYNECEVDKHVDDRCEGDDHPHKNIEEVIPVTHFL